LEAIQQRAMNIIFPDANYELALQIAEIQTLEERRVQLCTKLFEEIKDPGHKLHHLLPKPKLLSSQLRDQKEYPLPKCNTKRAQGTFINYCLLKLQ